MKIFKKALSLLLTAALLASTGLTVGVSAVGFENPALLSGRADPFVQYIDGYYYATWTINSRIAIAHSKTLKGMTERIEDGDFEVKTIYHRDMSNINEDFYTNIWAPEFYRDEVSGKWYFYASATKKGSSTGAKLFCLESVGTDIMGDYVFKSSLDISSLSWAINPSLYKAPTGQLYMTFVSGNGTNDLYIAKMKNYYTVDGSTATKISSAKYAWELKSNKSNEAGSFLVSGDKLYMAYSANNSANAEYCMGLLRFTGNYKTDNLCDASKWSKYSQPLLTGGNGIYCTGHSSFFKGPDDVVYMAYHGYVENYDASLSARALCVQPLELSSDGTPKLNQTPKPYVEEPCTAKGYTYEDVYIDDYAVTNHYSIGEDYNGHGIACNVSRTKLNANINEAQTYADMLQNGFHDNVNAPYVAITVKAPESGIYGIKVGFGIDSGFVLSSSKPYYLVVGVNDKHFYKGTERTVMTNGGYLAETMEVYLEKGVNIIRVLTLVPEVAKNYTSAWANVRYIKLDSRATALKKSQYWDKYIERDGLSSYSHYTKTDSGIVKVDPSDARKEGITYDNCKSFTQFRTKLPYVAMDMYAPYDGYYDISFYMQVGNTKNVGYYIVYVDKIEKTRQKLYSMGSGQTSRISGVYLTKGTHSIAISSALGYSTSDYNGGYSDWSDYFSLFYRYYDDKTYTVTLDNQQATLAGSKSSTAEYGSYPADITVPEKTGYSFEGYYTEQNGGGVKYYDASGKGVNGYKLTSDTTLYANWTENTVSAISSDKAMGTAFGSGVYEINTQVTLTAAANTGYHFVGWCDASGETVSEDSAYTFTVTENGAVYTASFAPNTDTVYKVRYWKQRSDTMSAPFNSSNYELAAENTLSGTTAQTVRPAAASYKGYATPAAQELTIAPDGSSVLDYYYKLGYGDVNSDTNVNASDLALLKKYLLGAESNVNSTLSDVNKDGEIELKDLLRLQRYLADADTPVGNDKLASVSVMYYNVYGWDAITTPNRLQKQVDMIADNAPDVACFQEYAFQHRDTATPLLKQKGYAEVPVREDGSVLNSFNENATPIYYRTDRLSVVESGGEIFPLECSFKKYTLEANNGEITKYSYTWAIFRDKASGKLFFASSVHFMYNSPHLTREQADAVRAFYAEVILDVINEVLASKPEYENIPVYIGGDLNSDPHTAGYEVLSTQLSSAADVAEEHKKIGYYGCYAKYDSSTGEYTYRQPVESDHILDHAFVKDSKIKSFLPITEFRALVTSDHLPWTVCSEF